MKFENLMLRCLFVACLAVCGLTLGAMLTATPASTPLANGQRTDTLLTATPSTCALPPDGVLCPRVGS